MYVYIYILFWFSKLWYMFLTDATIYLLCFYNIIDIYELN